MYWRVRKLVELYLCPYTLSLYAVSLSYIFTQAYGSEMLRISWYINYIIAGSSETGNHNWIEVAKHISVGTHETYFRSEESKSINSE
jgi:hypothetical protein